MTNVMISISPSSTFLTYEVIFQFHLHMVYIHRSLFDMQELADIRSVFVSRQSTDKQVDVTRVSTVLFTGSSPQILWSLQRSFLLIQSFIGPHAVC
jgi:hypothetical protein